ncbi:MAG: potassium channel family protein [Chloroflexota bacterium]
MKGGFRRVLRAQLRDLRVLLRESWVSLFLFVVLVTGGALLFHAFYVHPEGNPPPSFMEALHHTFALIFFEITLPFPGPEQWYLQVLYFVVPILGLAVAADGLLRFGTALLNKQSRGQKWQAAMALTLKNHVIVCGLGKVGYRVILELLKFGREVVGIESNPEGRFVEKVRALRVPLIIANARRSENLIKAGVKHADVIIPCTDDELTNLDIALDAREINPDIKVVMRLFDADLARRVEKGFGIETAYSTSALAAPIFAAAAMHLDIRHSLYVGDQLLNLSEITVRPGSTLVGWSVQQLEAEFNVSVVCHDGSQGTDLHPRADLCLQVGDRVLLLASLETLKRLQGLNRAADI